MPTPEGTGKARKAWDAYVKVVKGAPGVETLSRKLAVPATLDLTGFWLLWHLEGGFEGLQRLGMSRSSIYRRIRLFRAALGAHPDEYQMPGVTLDVVKYQTTPAVLAKSRN